MGKVVDKLIIKYGSVEIIRGFLISSWQWDDTLTAYGVRLLITGRVLKSELAGVSDLTRNYILLKYGRDIKATTGLPIGRLDLVVNIDYIEQRATIRVKTKEKKI
jgi:hypothetical protein